MSTIEIPDDVSLIHGDRDDQLRHLIAKSMLMQHVAKDPNIVAFLKQTAVEAKVNTPGRIALAWVDEVTRNAIMEKIEAFMLAKLKLRWPWFALQLHLIMIASIRGDKRLGDKFIDLSGTLGVRQEDVKLHQAPVIEVVRRNAVWFYRNRVKNPPDSISTLAREYHLNRHSKNCINCDDRKTVQDGINEAERILDLTLLEYAA